MKKLLSLAMITTCLLAVGCDDDKNQEETKPTCPSTCTNGCESDGVTCKSTSTCPSTCTNGCESDGTTCKQDDNNLDAGIDSVPDGQPTTGTCNAETFVNHCSGNKKVSCDGEDGNEAVHEDACGSDEVCVTVKKDGKNKNYCLSKCNENVGTEKNFCEINVEDDLRELMITRECRNSTQGKVWFDKNSMNCSTVCSLDNKGEATCGAEETCEEAGTVSCGPDAVATYCDEIDGKLIKYVVQCKILGEDVPCEEDWGCDEDWEEDEEEEGEE